MPKFAYLWKIIKLSSFLSHPKRNGFVTILLLTAMFLVSQMLLKTPVNALTENIFTPADFMVSRDDTTLDNETLVANIIITPTSIPVTDSPTPTPKVTVVPLIKIPTATPAPSLPEPTPIKSFPGEVIDLTDWKLTLPIGDDKHPAEIKQPALASYKSDPWFLVTADGNGIRFRAPVNGVTTSNSGYPRSELREMVDGGTGKASWSAGSGTHTLFLDQAITAVPATKKHLVAGQIHDSEDDILVIRLELPNLYVNVDGKNVYTLDSNYTLGKRFTTKFEVSGNQTKVYYNDSLAYTLNKSYSEAYFKTGAYTQSNCSKESSSLCNDTNFGEVVVYQAKVSHQ